MSKPKAPAEPVIIAQPWVERRDYPELLLLVPRMPRTWQEWRDRAGVVRKAAARDGVRVDQDRFNLLDLQDFLRRQERRRLSPTELQAWCQRRLDGDPDPPVGSYIERLEADFQALRKPKPRRST